MMEDLNHCSEMAQVFNLSFRFTRCEILCFWLSLLLASQMPDLRVCSWKDDSKWTKERSLGTCPGFHTQCEPTFPRSQPHSPGLAQVPTAQAHVGAVDLKAAEVMGLKNTPNFVLDVSLSIPFLVLSGCNQSPKS